MISVTDEQFKAFQKLIYQHSGIRLDDRKTTLLTTRLQRRLRKIAMDDVAAYLQIVSQPSGKGELQELLNVITTNETSFYRTTQHFDWFTETFLPEKLAQHAAQQRQPSLRIWSAACSIGAEPYTLVFCLDEFSRQFAQWDISIIASDLSSDSLATAKQARYTGRLIDSLDPPRVKKYFREISGVRNEHEILPKYRGQVEFFLHNLMHPMTRPKVDCIYLRNVLIYFDIASKKVVLKNMVDALAPGGYLVVGPSEGIYGFDHPLTKHSSFLYQKRS